MALKKFTLATDRGVGEGEGANPWRGAGLTASLDWLWSTVRDGHG